MKLGFWDRVWNFYRSIKVAVFMMSFLVTACVFGSLIEQNGSEEQYINAYGGMSHAFYVKLNALTSKIGLETPVFSEEYYVQTRGPKMYRALERMGMHDLYHSWWFLTALIMFSLNLISATVHTIPGVWRRAMHPRVDTPPRTLRRMEPGERWTVKGSSPAQTMEAARRVARSGGFRSRRKSTPEGEFLLAEKGRIRFAGPYVVHLSILVILGGALIGGFKGSSEYRPVIEGSSVAIPGTDAVVKVKDFQVKYNERYQPTEYSSFTDLYEGGKKIREFEIRVNHPLRHRGRSLYQSSFGWVLELKAADGETGETLKNFTVFDGDTFFLNEKRLAVEIVRFFPDLVVSMDGYQSASPELKDPGVYLRVYQNQRAVNEGLATKVRSLDAGGVKVVLTGVKQYTGLTFASDPGVPLVWIGSFLMILGLCLCFYIHYRQVWFYAGPDGEVAIAGKTHRFPYAFNQEFQTLADRFRDAIQGEGETRNGDGGRIGEGEAKGAGKSDKGSTVNAGAVKAAAFVKEGRS